MLALTVTFNQHLKTVASAQYDGLVTIHVHAHIIVLLLRPPASVIVFAAITPHEYLAPCLEMVIAGLTFEGGPYPEVVKSLHSCEGIEVLGHQ